MENKFKIVGNMKGQGLPIRTASAITLALIVMVLIFVTFDTQFNSLIETFVGKVEFPLG